MPEIFEPFSWNLDDLLKNKIFNIPIYQRPYSWEKHHVETLLNDILASFVQQENSNIMKKYYLGNFILFETNKKISNNRLSVYEIIDGQQRMTSLVIMLLSIYSLLKLYVTKTNLSEEKKYSINKKIDDLKNYLWKQEKKINNKDIRSLNLNSIEKSFFIELFDECFDNVVEIKKFSKRNNINKFEKLILENFKYFYDNLDKKFNNKIESFLDFIDYLLNDLEFIVIIAKCEIGEVFSIFESINSKGKRLEEIDLFKSFIFSELDKKDYDEYFKIWGNLTINTNDNLYNYFSIYIKSFIKFYKNDIKINNFKDICDLDLIKYFSVDSKKEAIKKLLKDMEQKITIYNYIQSLNEFYDNDFLKLDSKIKFNFNIMQLFKYEHPKAIFFRLFVEFSKGDIDKKDLGDICETIATFLLKYLAIRNIPSKEIIAVFAQIMNNIFTNKKVVFENIKYYIYKELKNNYIEEENIKDLIMKLDYYSDEKYRNLTKVFLSLYEMHKHKGRAESIYDRAYDFLKSIMQSKLTKKEIDHIMPQNPNKNDEKFKYFKNINGTLSLKTGHDFDKSSVFNGMNYDSFIKEILNDIGNLDIIYKDENIKKNNEISSFNSYSQIKERKNEIIDVVLKYLFKEKFDINEYEKNLPISTSKTKKMSIKEMIEKNILKPGTILCIIKKDLSDGELLKNGNILYKNQELSLNQWAILITGKKSINAYAYTVIKGEKETLDIKREKYI